MSDDHSCTPEHATEVFAAGIMEGIMSCLPDIVAQGLTAKMKLELLIEARQMAERKMEEYFKFQRGEKQ
jgi:hypothetical protein